MADDYVFPKVQAAVEAMASAFGEELLPHLTPEQATAFMDAQIASLKVAIVQVGMKLLLERVPVGGMVH